MNESIQSVHAALLPFLGVLRIGGTDAARFLQGQLTNDVQLLADGRTQLAAYNTPQGRVIALLRLHQGDDAIYALLPAELLERVGTLLRRFVLRSKVDLQIAADLQVGWIGTATLSPRWLMRRPATRLVPSPRCRSRPPRTWCRSTARPDAR